MSPDARVRIWWARLGPDAEPESVAALAGVDLEVARAARPEAASASTTEEDNGPAVPVRVVIARTLDLLERRFEVIAAAPERTRTARRYALFCLHGLLNRGGLIDRLFDLPWPLSRGWHDHLMHGLPIEERKQQRIHAFHARADKWSRVYRERATMLQHRYAGLLPCPDWRPIFFAVREPDPAWPPLPASWSGAAATDGIIARFGPIGQMLAASKSRVPWSARCVFNGRIWFADTNEPIWSGDLWLLPPTNANNDPRRGALDVARATGRSVAMGPESGNTPLWIAHPDGCLEVTPYGTRIFEIVVRMLERAGWPDPGQWPRFPVEHRVRTRAGKRVPVQTGEGPFRPRKIRT